MSDWAIRVKDLGKRYRIGGSKAKYNYRMLRDSLMDLTRAPFRWLQSNGHAADPTTVLWALRDVSFDVANGEVLGIIGRNGAGKSTLLKMLARISVPTRGSVTVKGKVAPLIEVGAGLVPDLTGRENIYLNGSILGMRRAEIAKKFDKIVAFAELEEFIDTPIKRYSSGMQVRLGFSIATSVDADILIVDEVLAVGDLAFQRKCFDRMQEIIKRQGKTVLLVSHNIRQVIRLCTRTLLLDHGRVAADGAPLTIAELFYEQSNRKIQADQATAHTENSRIKSSGEVELLEIVLLNSDDAPIDEIISGESLRIRVKLSVHERIEKPEIVVGTHTTDFVYLTAGSTAIFDERPDFNSGVHEIEHLIPSFPLVAGSYCVRLAVFDANGRLILAGETLKIFRVQPLPGEAKQPPLRNLHLPTAWVLEGQTYSDLSEKARHKIVLQKIEKPRHAF